MLQVERSREEWTAALQFEDVHWYRVRKKDCDPVMVCKAAYALASVERVDRN